MLDISVQIPLKSKYLQLNLSLDKKRLPKTQIKDKALKQIQSQEDSRKCEITHKTVNKLIRVLIKQINVTNNVSKFPTLCVIPVKILVMDRKLKGA